MRLPEILAELRRRAPALYWAGWVNLGLFAAMALVAPFDERTVLGVNTWLKPMKFTISVAAYLWTLGWLLGYLKGAAVWRKLVSGGVAVVMLIEIGCIVLQGARGVTSHYNVATAFDANVFRTMGIMIGLNSLLVLVSLVLFFVVRTGLPPAFLWGIRLGLTLLLAGSAQGGEMIVRAAHTVGAPDGGPGLPGLNWSTEAGDLRAAHLVGLHALQALPLAGWFLAWRWPGLGAGAQTAAIWLVAAAWTGLGLWLYRMAVAGAPLLPL
jgi:hypothetical protein